MPKNCSFGAGEGLAVILDHDFRETKGQIAMLKLYVDATCFAVEAVPDQFGKRCDRLRARLPGKEIVLHRDGNVLDHIRACLPYYCRAASAEIYGRGAG